MSRGALLVSLFPFPRGQSQGVGQAGLCSGSSGRTAGHPGTLTILVTLPMCPLQQRQGRSWSHVRVLCFPFSLQRGESPPLGRASVISSLPPTHNPKGPRCVKMSNCNYICEVPFAMCKVWRSPRPPSGLLTHWRCAQDPGDKSAALAVLIHYRQKTRIRSAKGRGGQAGSRREGLALPGVPPPRWPCGWCSVLPATVTSAATCGSMPRPPTPRHTVSEVRLGGPRPPGKWRHSYWAGLSRGSAVTSRELRAKVMPCVGQG